MLAPYIILITAWIKSLHCYNGLYTVILRDNFSVIINIKKKEQKKKILKRFGFINIRAKHQRSLIGCQSVAPSDLREFLARGTLYIYTIHAAAPLSRVCRRDPSSVLEFDCEYWYVTSIYTYIYICTSSLVCVDAIQPRFTLAGADWSRERQEYIYMIFIRLEYYVD